MLTHRERKSSCGVGTAPCWQAQVAVLRVPWRVGGWSLVGLAGERAWGLERAPVPPPGRWSAGQPLPGRCREPWELEGWRPLLTGAVRDWGDDLDRRVIWGECDVGGTAGLSLSADRFHPSHRIRKRRMTGTGTPVFPFLIETGNEGSSGTPHRPMILEGSVDREPNRPLW